MRLKHVIAESQIEIFVGPRFGDIFDFLVRQRRHGADRASSEAAASSGWCARRSRGCACRRGRSARAATTTTSKTAASGMRNGVDTEFQGVSAGLGFNLERPAGEALTRHRPALFPEKRANVQRAA